MPIGRQALAPVQDNQSIFGAARFDSPGFVAMFDLVVNPRVLAAKTNGLSGCDARLLALLRRQDDEDPGCSGGKVQIQIDREPAGGSDLRNSAVAPEGH